MKRLTLWTVAVSAAALVTWQAVSALNQTAPAEPVVKPQPAPLLSVKDITPMKDRVATLGILNKRNGLWRNLKMKPGEAVRLGDVVVRLSACEQTAPWEQEKWTGAFVQVIAHDPDTKWRRYFSGWLYKESPSLNVVENPIWDVWVKDCQMKYPDTGKDTVVVHGGDEGDDSGDTSAAPRQRRSNIVRSAPEAAPEPAAPEEDVAVDNAVQ
ncbi:MAG: hypothetical protein RL367_1606 [Pseudomonadota bacterium]